MLLPFGVFHEALWAAVEAHRTYIFSSLSIKDTLKISGPWMVTWFLRIVG